MHRRVGYRNYDGKIAGMYDLEETLGSGNFAVVKLARHVFTGEKVAVKVIDKTKLDEVSKSHLFQEVRCMKMVQHPNVVRLYEVIDTQTKLYLILELGDGGDLYDYIMRHDSGLSEEAARTYFRQIVRAIAYCHRLHVVHRDLKPENVVFFEKLGTVKLTDFGFSNRFCPGQKLETSCGSLAYSAPEILLGESYDAPAVDVWSLGVILYELVCGQAPFREANDSETLTMILDCKYSIPSHMSAGCRDLIAKMLVREPEKRATLEEIINDPWLAIDEDDDPADCLPLITRESLTDEYHNLIISKMVSGNIATEEEILEALDKNEYNHITATYFLLAERKLRAQRQEHVQKQRPGLLNSRRNDHSTHGNPLGNLSPCLLSVPRSPGDLIQNTRTRKCSIVQEEEDEDEVSSGRDDHGSNSGLNSLNRRGSRSEGKLSHVLQERLSQLPEKHKQPSRLVHLTDGLALPSIRRDRIRPHRDSSKSSDESVSSIHNKSQCESPGPEVLSSSNANSSFEENVKNRLSIEKDKKPESLRHTSPSRGNSWRINVQHSRSSDGEEAKAKSCEDPPAITKILTECSTMPTPIRPTRTLIDTQITTMPKYKTMPSPISNEGNTPLNEILEDCDTISCSENSTPNATKCRLVRRISYEQRRSRFHNRTTSCSSSDASEDDDSENRKKRAHKLGASPVSKPLPPTRRDDDSSDSQDPGTGGGSRGGLLGNLSEHADENSVNENNTRNDNDSTSNTTTGTTGTGGKQHGVSDAQVICRRHRRRAGQTRLRESQSLNRITESESETVNACNGPRNARGAAGAVESPKNVSGQQTVNSNVLNNNSTISVTASTMQKAKGFTRLLQGWSLGNKSTAGIQEANAKDRRSQSVTSATSGVTNFSYQEKENCGNNPVHRNDCKSKKIRLLSRYFAVHKKLCVPLPGIFGKGKLYKARSCGNISRERINPPSPKSMLVLDDRWF